MQGRNTGTEAATPGLFGRDMRWGVPISECSYIEGPYIEEYFNCRRKQPLHAKNKTKQGHSNRILFPRKPTHSRASHALPCTRRQLTKDKDSQ
jgi:hypothetical protein